MDLTDRVALVTSASSGIGKATSIALADEGVRVGLAARREGQLAEVADEIEAENRTQEETIIPPPNSESPASRKRSAKR